MNFETFVTGGSLGILFVLWLEWLCHHDKKNTIVNKKEKDD